MAKLVKAVLIDPFQQEIYPVRVENNYKRIAELLDCDWIQSVNLNLSDQGTKQYAWVDEEGLLRQPFVYPHWTLCATSDRPPINQYHGLAGYGLITGMADGTGEILSSNVPLAAWAKSVLFEPWRHRIPIDDCIPQMLRVYDIAR